MQALVGTWELLPSVVNSGAVLFRMDLLFTGWAHVHSVSHVPSISHTAGSQRHLRAARSSQSQLSECLESGWPAPRLKRSLSLMPIGGCSRMLRSMAASKACALEKPDARVLLAGAEDTASEGAVTDSLIGCCPE